MCQAAPLSRTALRVPLGSTLVPGEASRASNARTNRTPPMPAAQQHPTVCASRVSVTATVTPPTQTSLVSPAQWVRAGSLTQVLYTRGQGATGTMPATRAPRADTNQMKAALAVGLVLRTGPPDWELKTS